jgi:hypothetical protein
MIGSAGWKGGFIMMNGGFGVRGFSTAFSFPDALEIKRFGVLLVSQQWERQGKGKRC